MTTSPKCLVTMVARCGLYAAAVFLLVLTGCDQHPPAKANSTTPPAQQAPSAAPAAQPIPPPTQSAPPVRRIEGEASLARNFYFVLDGSGSMNEAAPRSEKGSKQFRSKIEGAKWAIAEFLAAVPQDAHLGLYVFDAGGDREVVPLSSNSRDAFMNAVSDVRADRGTPLGEAIIKGVDVLTAQREKQLWYGDYRLIVVTDGEANGHISIKDAAAHAAKRGVPIYTIGFGTGDKHQLKAYSVAFRAADNAEQVKQGLQETLAETEAYDAATFKKR